MTKAFRITRTPSITYHCQMMYHGCQNPTEWFCVVHGAAWGTGAVGGVDLIRYLYCITVLVAMASVEFCVPDVLVS